MRVDPSTSLRALRADYRAACAANDSIIDSIADPDTRFTRAGKEFTLRALLLIVLKETARHAGHADVIREQIDGRTGR